MSAIRIPDYFRPPLERLAAMSVDDLTAVHLALRSLEPKVKPEALVASLAAHPLCQKLPELVELAKALSGMSIARIDRDIPLDEFVESVAESLPQLKGKIEERATFESRLKDLLSIGPFLLSARAFSVQHEYQHVFTGARVVTDLRPVFDQSGVAPQGLMIVHNLKVRYIHSGEEKEILFALDDADIILLKSVLVRAETKSASLERVIASTGISYLESKEP